MGKFGTFLFGGIVGAGIALLCAPRPGEETRAIIVDKMNENYPEATALIQENGKKILEATATTSTKVINTVVDNANEVKRNIQSGAQSVGVPVSGDKNDELRAKIDEARKRIATQVAKNAEAAHDAVVDKIPAAADAAKAAADTAKSAANTAKEAVTDAAKNVSDKAQDVAKDVADKAQDVAKNVADKAQDAAKNVADKAQGAAKKTSAKGTAAGAKE